MANVEGVQEALDAMRAEGRAEGHAEGYKAGRAHAAAILGHAEAKGREPLASKLAANAAIGIEEAGDILASSPKSDSGSYLAKLQKDDPKLAEPAAPPADDKAERIKELAAVTKAVVGQRRR